MTDDFSTFWWENITGPRLFLEEIARCLSEGFNVVVHLTDSLVWQDQLPDLVRHRLQDAAFCTLTWQEQSRNEVVLWLLRNICPHREPMCPGEYDAQMRYLQKEEILGNCVGWIRARPEDNLDSLVQYLNDSRRKSLKRDGAFVLQVDEDARIPPLSGRVKELFYSTFIRFGDSMLFASILADANIDISPALKNYAACLAANLAQGSVEMIPDLIHLIRYEEEDPAAALLNLWEEELLPLPDRLPEKEELDQRVWRAQIQSVFAGIEMERLLIVAENSDLIENALSTEYWNPKLDRTGYIWQHDYELQSPSDVELGTMTWMMNLRCNADRTQYLLYLPDPELRNWINFLTECRNNLAHHRFCSPEQMNRLLTNLRS